MNNTIKPRFEVRKVTQGWMVVDTTYWRAIITTCSEAVARATCGDLNRDAT